MGVLGRAARLLVTLGRTGGWPRLGRVAGICGLVAVNLCSANLGDRSLPEAALKARFTVELAAYLTFPPRRNSAPEFVVAVVGESPFQGELDAYANRVKVIHGKPVRVVHLLRLPKDLDCDVLFLCRSEWPRARAILAECRGKGILTVAEGEHLAEQGVMVSLLVGGGRLQLGLNQKALEEEGFIVGSQVLSVARVLVPPSGKP